MHGMGDLKTKIVITDKTVECPVKGCRRTVDRQRQSFRCEERFLCPVHRIYISPSTFEYAAEKENLLWHDQADMDLLAAVKKVKRESRMARDNSEDALTWNVFRGLEKAGQIANLLSWVTQAEHRYAELIYWSYFQPGKGAWLGLNKARKEFGEHLQRSSEPDLIAVTDKALFFIEMKLTATNDTSPSQPKNQKKYLTGGGEWHQQVFTSHFDRVAIQAKKYELFRFWLLGSWLAREMDRDFYLLNIVRAARETDIEARFTPHTRFDHRRTFKRLSWEEIYGYIAGYVPQSREKRKLVAYFQNKTIGYNGVGVLQKAFMLDSVG